MTTLTIRIGHEPTTPFTLPHLALREETRTGLKTLGLLAVAPLIGLVFIVAAPLAGLAMLARYAVKALVEDGRLLKTLRNVALFFAAPLIGLGYIIAMPFVGLGALVWYGFKAIAGHAGATHAA